MPQTMRQLLVEAVVARMRDISVANGFETNVGALVEDWPRRFDHSELPALAVCDLSDRSQREDRESNFDEHTLSIQVRVLVAEGQPAEFLRQAIGDVQKAVRSDLFWNDATLGDLATGTYPRRTELIVQSDAMELAGAVVEFEVTYVTEPFNPFE